MEHEILLHWKNSQSFVYKQKILIGSFFFKLVNCLDTQIEEVCLSINKYGIINFYFLIIMKP